MVPFQILHKPNYYYYTEHGSVWSYHFYRYYRKDYEDEDFA